MCDVRISKNTQITNYTGYIYQHFTFGKPMGICKIDQKKNPANRNISYFDATNYYYMDSNLP